MRSSNRRSALPLVLLVIVVAFIAALEWISANSSHNRVESVRTAASASPASGSVLIPGPTSSPASQGAAPLGAIPPTGPAPSPTNLPPPQAGTPPPEAGTPPPQAGGARPQASGARPSVTLSPSKGRSNASPATATPSPVPVTLGPSNGLNQPVAAPTVAMLPPNAAPRIHAVALSSSIVSAGQGVSGTVTTSSNVASVVARVAGYSLPMRKVGTGHFALTYTVPNLPFFLHRTFTIDVIARNTRGDATSTQVPITVH